MSYGIDLCPEQDSNLHASQHSHLKRARLPFRHLGIADAKLMRFFELSKLWTILIYLFGFIWLYLRFGATPLRLIRPI